jgi:hypothetical protein
MKLYLGGTHKWIVCNGNVIDGHTFHGVFDSIEEAQAWGTDNFDVTGFFVVSLHPIKEMV